MRKYLRLDCSLLVLAILPVVSLNIGFLFGGSCSAWYFYVSLIIVLALTAIASLRRALVMLMVVGLLFVDSLYVYLCDK